MAKIGVIEPGYLSNPNPMTTEQSRPASAATKGSNSVSEEVECTAEGQFTYRGNGKLQEGLIKLLVCLQISGARLQKFDGFSGMYVFISNGLVQFTVAGSAAQVDRFCSAYSA